MYYFKYLVSGEEMFFCLVTIPIVLSNIPLLLYLQFYRNNFNKIKDLALQGAKE